MCGEWGGERLECSHTASRPDSSRSRCCRGFGSCLAHLGCVHCWHVVLLQQCAGSCRVVTGQQQSSVQPQALRKCALQQWGRIIYLCSGGEGGRVEGRKASCCCYPCPSPQHAQCVCWHAHLAGMLRRRGVQNAQRCSQTSLLAVLRAAAAEPARWRPQRPVS